MLDKINKIMSFLLKIISYIALIIICWMSIFTPELLNSRPTNELISVCTLILVGILNKD
jgi:hypothetical protein